MLNEFVPIRTQLSMIERGVEDLLQYIQELQDKVIAQKGEIDSRNEIIKSMQVELEERIKDSIQKDCTSCCNEDWGTIINSEE